MSSSSGAVVWRGVCVLVGSSNPSTGLRVTLPCRLPHLKAPLSKARALFIRLLDSPARRIRPKALSSSAMVIELARFWPIGSLSQCE